MATTGLTPTSLEVMSATARQNKNERFWGEALYHAGLKEQIFYTISLKASTHTHTWIVMNNSDDAFASYSAETSKPVNELPTHLQWLRRAKAVGSACIKAEIWWKDLCCVSWTGAGLHHADLLSSKCYFLTLWHARRGRSPSLLCRAVSQAKSAPLLFNLWLCDQLSNLRRFYRASFVFKNRADKSVGEGRAHSEIWLFVLWENSLSLTDFAKSSPYGGWRLEKTLPWIPSKLSSAGVASYMI